MASLNRAFLKRPINCRFAHTPQYSSFRKERLNKYKQAFIKGFCTVLSLYATHLTASLCPNAERQIKHSHAGRQELLRCNSTFLTK